MTNETDRIEQEINRSRSALNDTIEQLGGKLSPGQILDEAMGLMQGQAGKLTANLGRQVRDNPLPLLLIGAGAAMLFMKKHEGQPAPYTPSISPDEWQHEQRHRKLESVRAGFSKLVGETQDAFDHRLHEAEAAALDLKQHAGEAIDAFKARVTRTREGVALKAAEIRDRMNAAGSHAAQFAKDQAHNLKEGAADAKHKAQAFYDDYPLAAGAIGVAIGAIIGAAAPLSSVERDNLQGVAGAAAKAGADMAEKGAHAAQRAADKAAAALH
jgi:ElaB/YqjD/DUF883 family membrane-anchored ribosome-binding protein